MWGPQQDPSAHSCLGMGTQTTHYLTLQTAPWLPGKLISYKNRKQGKRHEPKHAVNPDSRRTARGTARDSRKVTFLCDLDAKMRNVIMVLQTEYKWLWKLAFGKTIFIYVYGMCLWVSIRQMKM